MTNNLSLERALFYANEKHLGQTRDNGVPFIIHPFSAVAILMRYGEVDVRVLCAAALHDVVEDGGVTFEELEQEFGKPVASVVEEVTHLKDGSFPLKTREGFVVKMADRLSNLNDLHWCAADKQKRVVKSTVKFLGSYGKELQAANMDLYCALVELTVDLI